MEEMGWNSDVCDDIGVEFDEAICNEIDMEFNDPQSVIAAGNFLDSTNDFTTDEVTVAQFKVIYLIKLCNTEVSVKFKLNCRFFQLEMIC